MVSSVQSSSSTVAQQLDAIAHRPLLVRIVGQRGEPPDRPLSAHSLAEPAASPASVVSGAAPPSTHSTTPDLHSPVVQEKWPEPESAAQSVRPQMRPDHAGGTSTERDSPAASTKPVVESSRDPTLDKSPPPSSPGPPPPSCTCLPGWVVGSESGDGKAESAHGRARSGPPLLRRATPPRPDAEATNRPVYPTAAVLGS
ncbi:proline-rich receptor-like protein kinase PERK8 [Setaria italica]|uniref:proline-rich receptor-like protein kinase PERK8 n=1 Tax=Setaria italica TaxID=4555 RepID=UPI000350D039|nr:proline-rich receptor-like protein kinase PERK8 [Setaria italica]